jgi:pyruvate dehydrogenase E2 component (dihydrolipoamide acetyltransferase)
MAGFRQSIAENLRSTLSTAAPTTLTREVDASLLVVTRRQLAEKIGSAPSYSALFIKLLGRALRDFVEWNATVESDSIVVFDDIHIGFAVASPRGLIVPVIQHADSTPLLDIVHAVRDLTDRAVGARLRPADVQGGTASITNLGGHGIDAFTPILNGSQSVILGIGRIAERPVVRGGALSVNHTCVLSLTFDHRVGDGVSAAKLLDKIVSCMNSEFVAS